MKIFFSFFLLFVFSCNGIAAPDFSAFAKIPVQADGRIKPLDSFARSQLLAFNGKESLGEVSAIAWISELLFEPDLAYTREVFNLPNPDAVNILGLQVRQNHRYSFQELFPSLRQQQELLKTLREQEREQRSLAQNQILDLDAKVARFFEISRSLSLLLPIFSTDNPALAFKLGLEPNKLYTYLDLLRLRDAVKKAAEENTPGAVGILKGFDAIEGWPIPEVFRILPPQFRKTEEWSSPWKMIQDGDGSPAVAESLKLLRSLALDYHQSNWEHFSSDSLELLNHSEKMTEAFRRPGVLDAEVIYSKVSFFQKALAFYVAAFLTLLLGWLVWGERLRSFSFILLLCGAAFHAVGLAMRIFIMARPPVSTLYESILFVSLVAMIGAIAIEKVKGRGIGILIGSVLSSALLFVSFSYATEGDTMGVLVAVLNTNFWLATHVVCITIGYGTCLVGGLLGHVYLIAAVFGRGKIQLSELFRSMIGVSLVALFFAMFGTILGGIWADQSWGRFWGWDPKENGALLIVLWLLFLMHGRIAGRIKATGYALGMVLTNVVVALAWFGVNLLSIGLHSYGFTENIALNLFLFCAAELSFALLMYHHAKLRALIR